jgi:hypothetical protein
VHGVSSECGRDMSFGRSIHDNPAFTPALSRLLSPLHIHWRREIATMFG